MLFLQQLTQEKNELREEKASLKSAIQDLKAQQHQRAQGFMVPWDSSILMVPFSVAVSVPPARPLPPYVNQYSATSTFIPYITASTSDISRPRVSSTGSTNQQISSMTTTGNSNDVATDLELKIPGSAPPKVGVFLLLLARYTQIKRGFSYFFKMYRDCQ